MAVTQAWVLSDIAPTQAHSADTGLVYDEGWNIRMFPNCEGLWIQRIIMMSHDQYHDGVYILRSEQGLNFSPEASLFQLAAPFADIFSVLRTLLHACVLRRTSTADCGIASLPIWSCDSRDLHNQTQSTCV